MLGSGGMGRVWLAYDRVLDRSVAVKEITGIADEQLVARAVREGKAASRIHHHNVVTVFDLFHENGRPYIVSEYVEGTTLADMIKLGELQLADVALWGSQTANGLHQAHRLGIVHRDIKPANIMISKTTRTAKIVDFGIARVEGATTITSVGSFLGTPAFAAPEVANGSSVTSQADIWSLGATLYQCVELRTVFDSDDAIAIIYKLLKTPLNIEQPRSAGLLGGLIMRMLSERPDARPTAETVHRQLSEVHDQIVAAAHATRRDSGSVARGKKSSSDGDGAKGQPGQARPKPNVDSIARKRELADLSKQQKEQAHQQAEHNASEYVIAERKAEAQRRVSARADAQRRIEEQDRGKNGTSLDGKRLTPRPEKVRAEQLRPQGVAASQQNGATTHRDPEAAELAAKQAYRDFSAKPASQRPQEEDGFRLRFEHEREPTDEELYALRRANSRSDLPLILGAFICSFMGTGANFTLYNFDTRGLSSHPFIWVSLALLAGFLLIPAYAILVVATRKLLSWRRYGLYAEVRSPQPSLNESDGWRQDPETKKVWRIRRNKPADLGLSIGMSLVLLISAIALVLLPWLYG